MPHAFLWQNGVMTDLGVLPGDEDSGAAAINNLGQIVGSSGRTDPDTYETTSRSFLYENGVMTALPVPSSESYAGDINDSGVVVGTMRAPRRRRQLPRLHLRRRRRDEPEQPAFPPAPASTSSTPTASTTPARSSVWPTTRSAATTRSC